ncbi:MAG: protein-glutamate O-methyltransferase CheR [Candidatus Wallbacteria bacterium]|nr:protein-glutamate O-methyltransferase CheR [Candidatus Wallbacteria bacterium]
MRTPSSSAELDRFRAVIAAKLGLALDDGKLDLLSELLGQRCAKMQMGSGWAYLDWLESSTEAAGELRLLVPQVTVGETYFFRNPASFNALAEVALPDRLRSPADGAAARMMSVGCASGEEPYSMAIAAQEGPCAGAPMRIQAIDANTVSLDRARRARYSLWSLRQTSEGLRRRWFQPAGSDFELVERARRLVEFEERNLADPLCELASAGTLDIVFCRNVLMYFTAATMEAVVERLARALAPGGYLFLGDAETLWGITQSFHLRHTHDAFYYQRRESDAYAPPLAPASPDWRAAGLLDSLAGDGTWVETIHQSLDRIEQLTRHSGRAPTAAAEAASSPATDLSQATQLMQEERFGDALDVLHALPAAQAADPDAMLLRAVLLTNRGRPDEAERVCRLLLELDELDAGAHYVMALCREHAGDLPGAVEHDQAAAYLDPGFAMPRLHMGRLTRRAGNLERARRELEQAALLLTREDSSRILLFGGGFSRDALGQVCRAELRACGGAK